VKSLTIIEFHQLLISKISNTQQDTYNRNRELWGVADDITRNAKPSNAAIDWRSLAFSPDLIGFNPARNIVSESSTAKHEFGS
jgi:hypothetical protein